MHNIVLEMAVLSSKSSLLFITFSNSYLIIGTIFLLKQLAPSLLDKKSNISTRVETLPFQYVISSKKNYRMTDLLLV